MIRASASKILLLLAFALAAPLAAHAQWQWTDNTGRRVFSDQPPPPDIPDKNILRRPANAPRAAAPVAEAATAAASAASAAAAATAAASAPRPAAGRERELEERKKQAEAAEAAKKKADEERIARIREQNCSLAKQAKATIDSGIRLARVNDKGEREILDDNARAAEVRRLEGIIASDCKAG